MRRLWNGFVLALAFVGGCSHDARGPVAASAPDAAALVEAGSAAYDRGRFEDAITAWGEAAARSRVAGDKTGEADARTSLAAAQMMIGRYDLAVESLSCAWACAEQAGDVGRKAKALNALGAAYTFNPNAGVRPGGGEEKGEDPHAAHRHHGGGAPASAPASPGAGGHPQAAANPAGELAARDHVGPEPVSLPKPAAPSRAGSKGHCAGPPSREPAVLFSEALRLAEETGDARQQASIQNNLGNYHARTAGYEVGAAGERTANFDKALAAYAEAGKLAAGADPLLACKASVNGALAALTAVELEQAEQATRVERLRTALKLNDAGRGLAAGLADSHDKAFLLITAGQTAEQIGRFSPKIAAAQRAVARECYERANAVADATGDLRSRSYASGYLGGLYLDDKRLEEAERFTRRAIMAAQQARLPDSLYRWEWQNARLYRARWDADKLDDASLNASIRFYAAATQPVQFIRNDISLGHGNGRKRVGFRDSIGSLYFEYADMLLRRAERVSGGGGGGEAQADERARAGAVAALYVRARSTVEQLKAVELENYFQDECVHLLKNKQKSVPESINATTAVLYLIPLADRTEILVSFRGDEFFRAKSTLTGAKLKRAADLLRSQISDSDQVGELEPYQRTAAFLYDELIKPIRAELDRRQIKTLVFVPDGPLRMIPMAVLYHQGRHLIEDFAIAITPGLELLEPKSIARTNVQLLASGLSKGREEFGDLTMVPQELANIKKFYANGTTLLNADFVQPKLERAMEQTPYSIVHIASHAVFGADASKSFLLTYDDKMKLDDIERLIRPYQLRDQPVELLTLSACESAAGDNERAALGLAGIAVKAGARAAVASLWSVDEESSVDLMSDFYQALSRANASGDLAKQVSKAQAMQEAQVQMLRGQKYNHPFYWAPFLVIGNWL